MTLSLRPHNLQRGRPRLVSVVLGVVLLMGACQANDPAAATPRDNAGLLEELARHGVTVVDQRSGDPGCPFASLAPNAVHWRLRVADDVTPRDVYLFRFRDRTTFQVAGSTIDACQAAFEARSSRAGGPVSRIDISPWRTFGDGWSANLHDALVATLTLAAGNGGSTRPGGGAQP